MSCKVLLNIELPPPMHGMTYINKIIYNNLKDDSSYSFYNTNFTSDVSEVGGFAFKKVFRNFSVVYGAWRAFFHHKPERVYTIASASLFGIVRDMLVNLPALMLNKHMILHLHGFTYYIVYQKSKIYKVLFDFFSKNATLVVLCEKQKEKSLEVLGKNSIVLHNCLHVNNKYKKKTLNTKVKICYISNISKDKGTFELIKAVKKMEDVELVVAGNFLSDKEEFFRLIDGDESINYAGFADDSLKDEILSSSDIFCLPSKLEEGSPISIIEAMSYGLPVVASDKGCIKDMIVECGEVLANNFTDDDIILSVENVINDYDRYSTNALKQYNDNYRQEVFIEKLNLILKGM